MSDGERSGGWLGGDSSLSVLLVVVALVLSAFGVAAVLQVRDARDDAAMAEARADNAQAAADAAATMNDVLATVGALASDVATAGVAAAPPSAPGLVRVAVVPVDPDRARVRALLSDGIDVVALRPSLDRARDSVDGPLLAAPVGAPPASAVVVALYEGSSGGLSLAASNPATATRRAELAGHLVAVVDLEAVAVAIGEGPWVLSDGPVVLQTGSRPDAVDAAASTGVDVVETSLDVGGRQWRLARTVTDSVDGALVALGGLFVLAAVLVTSLGRRATLALRRREDDAQRARGRADTVATLSGVTRESNDLGDILPGLAVHLGDTLGLDGLALAVPAGDGTMREAFAHGSRPDLDHAVRLREVDTVAAGQTVSVPLHRAGRSIATLSVVAGRVLTPDEIDLLEVAAEMVTAAVVTARSLEQQQDAVARLQSVDELKTAFLGTASHELRTPVTAISGFALMLVDRWDDLGEADRRVFAERIASNARALEELVQDLLDFARLERGEHAMAFEPLDLPVIVASVLERLEPVWEHHTIASELEAGVAALGDRAALERVVTNLVSNAAKFAPPGTTVAVGVRRDGEHAVLTVDDEGPGVPIGERDKIFARFFRGSSQAVVRTRGVGIGLSVVKDFIERMHGTIEVTDSPSGGARFVVVLPLVGPADGGTREEHHDVSSA